MVVMTFLLLVLVSFLSIILCTTYTSYHFGKGLMDSSCLNEGFLPLLSALSLFRYLPLI
jgi:hypothetical protein